MRGLSGGGVRRSRHTRSGQRRTLQYPLEQSPLELQYDPGAFLEAEQLPLELPLFLYTQLELEVEKLDFLQSTNGSKPPPLHLLS